MHANADVARRAIGAMFFTGFGGLWIALYALDVFGVRPTIWVSIVLLTGILFSAAYRRYCQYRAALKTEAELPEQRRRDRLFNLINAAQWLLIIVVANALSYFGMAAWIIPAIVLIVGLHFLPLAHIFSRRSHYATGAALIAAAIVCPLVATSGPHDPTLCLLAGLILWASALFAIARPAIAADSADQA